MPQRTFADIKDDPALQALSIDIHAFDTIITKEWVKASLEDSHWQRIHAIAETSPDQLVADPGGATPGSPPSSSAVKRMLWPHRSTFVTSPP